MSPGVSAAHEVAMQIHTTARHFELAEADRAFLQQRMQKLSKFARDLNEAHVTVTAEGFRHTAEITIKLKGRDVVSREQSAGARAAIDLAADRLEQQLRRIKEIRIDRSHGRLGRNEGNGAIEGETGTEAEE